MAEPALVIRDAVPSDAEGILEVYRPFVLDTAVSFEMTPPTVDEMRERIGSAQSRWSWLVADDGGVIAGYAYASAFRARVAYKWTAETSAYLLPGYRGRKIASRLYRRLFDVLIAKGFCNAYAGIAMPNDASVAFHQAMGFTEVGTFHRAGWKFDQWHDVSWWERALALVPPVPTPSGAHRVE
ncbi:MAG: N-acetyltransferase family protein [Vicinamibacteria bacterium]